MDATKCIKLGKSRFAYCIKQQLFNSCPKPKCDYSHAFCMICGSYNHVFHSCKLVPYSIKQALQHSSNSRGRQRGRGRGRKGGSYRGYYRNNDNKNINEKDKEKDKEANQTK